jgi:hypothetical protein
MRSIEDEYEGARFGDQRLNARLKRLAGYFSARPGDSFPDMVPDESQLEAVYRFVNNDRVTLRKVLEPHAAATLHRAKEEGVIIVAHDTTGFRYEGRGRRGLGRLLQKGRGFYAHMALAVTRDEVRDPLGILAVSTIVRGDERTDKKRDKNAKIRRNNRESLRWGKLVEEVSDRCQGVVETIHVMDREADSYELFEHLINGKHRFVIRSQHDRSLEAGGKLLDALASAPLVVEREVGLAARVGHSAPTTRKIHPPREARNAKLSISATRVAVKNPLNRELSLELNLVRVLETEPPEGCPAVEWRLATTEPVDTSEQVLAVVDAYRARWRIEEYFKALKTGCALEKRQLETLDALLNALGLFIPIAWNLLRLRVLSRQEQPASKVLGSTQLKVLRASSKKELPAHLSVRDAMLAIAKLGGHLKRNGDPGWITLGRGYERLLVLEEGWKLAKPGNSRRRCDQS